MPGYLLTTSGRHLATTGGSRLTLASGAIPLPTSLLAAVADEDSFSSRKNPDRSRAIAGSFSYLTNLRDGFSEDDA